MKLKSLYLENYIGVFQGLGLNKLFIDFSKCRYNITVFKGDNGSGKSSIFNTIHPMCDNSSSYINKKRAVKCIEYFMNDNYIISIKYVSDIKSDGSGDRKPTKCHILKIYPNGTKEDLNPTCNMHLGEDTIFTLFSIDSNFIYLSQLSVTNRGLVDLKPYDRKRFISSILTSVVTFINMYKKFSKKSTIVKSMINNISVKLSQIGNISLIQKSITQLNSQLSILEEQKNNLITSIAKNEQSLTQLIGDSNPLEEQNELLKELRNNDFELNKIDKNIVKETYSEKEILDLEKDLSKYETQIEIYENQLNDYINNENSIRKEINDKEIKLHSLYDINLINSIKNKIKELEYNLNTYENLFKKIGFDKYDIITEQEYNIAINSIEQFNQNLEEIANSTDYSIKEEAAKYVLSNTLYSKKYTSSILNDMQSSLNDLISIISNQESIIKSTTDYESIPKDCNHLDDCPFINSIISKRKNLLDDSKYQLILDKKESLINSIKQYQNEQEKEISLITCISSMNSIVKNISNIYSLLSKFPDTEILSSKKKILNCIVECVKINLNTSIYYQNSNYITLISSTKKDINLLKEKLEKMETASTTSVILKDNISKLYSDITQLLKFKSSLIAKLENIKNNKLTSETRLQYISSLKTNKLLYEQFSIKNKEIRDKLEELTSKSKEYSKLKELLLNDKNKLDRLNNSDIPVLKNQLDKYKYSIVLYGQYKKDYEEFSSIYNTLEILKKNTSFNGIQADYMKIFMNDIVQTTNSLYANLFGGRFTLQLFEINETEFRIPCLNNITGELIPDISLMSMSESCMISMIISFVLLHKSTDIYNIIKLDEIDGNLDAHNRLYFAQLISMIMRMLNFEQCIIISHNNELDLSNTDIVVLKMDDREEMNMLNGNIIYNYNLIK